MTDLPPGPELDAAVAEKVMGWRRNVLTDRPELYVNHVAWWKNPDSDAPGSLRHTGGPENYSKWAFCPSTRIADAWEVVRHIRSAGYPIGIYMDDNASDPPETFDATESPAGVQGFRGWFLFCSPDTAPYAISLAALKAVSNPLPAEHGG